MKNSALRFSRYITMLYVLINGFSAFAQESILLASASKKPAFDDVIITAGDVVEQEHQHPDVEEDEKPSLTFSGSVDTYFRTSFKTRNYYNNDAYAPSTAFSDLKGFAIGMVNLVASYSGQKAGFTADLVFGPRGQAAIFGSASGQAIINQAYVFYNFSDKLTLNIGQFNTFVGYEVISPAVNFHYSTSYLFSWGPFNHTGARLDYALDNGIVTKLALLNPTDMVEFNPVNTYYLGAQIGKSSDAGGFWLNFLYGDQDGRLVQDDAVAGQTSAGKVFQADITLGYDLSPIFYLGLNASIQRIGAGEEVDDNGTIVKTAGPTSSFMGVAVYPKVSLTNSFALGLRAEYFSVNHNHLNIFGLNENGNGDVVAFTLSGNYRLGNLMFIPEVRIDKTTENSFYREATPRDMLASVNIAAVYKF